jgi:ferritin-like protein
MGQLAQDLFPGSRALVPMLNQAYADEWFGHYNYFFAAQMVRGPSAASLGVLLLRKSDECLSRSRRLAFRICELGGPLIPKLSELLDLATDKPFKLPGDLGDVAGLLAAVLDAERTSIRTYHRLYSASRDVEPLTEALALELLGVAVRGEQELEILLGEPASEKDGT